MYLPSRDERITAIADLDEDVPNLGDDDKDSEDTTKDLAGRKELTHPLSEKDVNALLQRGKS